MREILFRGKRIDNGEWMYGNLEVFNGCIYHIVPLQVYIHTSGIPSCEYYNVDPDTIGQYTGLTANGKKIFEGDIIRGNYEGAVGVVRFGEYMSPSDPDFTRNIGYYVDWQGKEKDFLRADLGYWASRSDVKVIGNIHDNPELLEDKP